VRFDPLSHAMERQRGAKPDCRVIRREIHAEFFEIHACQFRLTILICQPKLTQQIATPGRSDGRVTDAIIRGQQAESLLSQGQAAQSGGYLCAVAAAVMAHGMEA
jgi:hypothetical protein